MKKLMIAAVAVAFAAIANASTYSWDVSNIAAYGDDTSSDGYQAWLIENYAGTITADNFQDVVATYGTVSAWTDPSEGGAYEGATNGSSADHGAGETVSARVFVANVFDDGTGTGLAEATAFWVSDAQTTVSDSAMGVFSPAALSFDASATAVGSNWTQVGAVPEPTSGLLLLLGVAGLALRRRRA